MKLGIILYSEPVQNTLRTSLEIRNHDICVNQAENVLTMSGLAGIKASSKEDSNYEKATAAHQRLFLLFEGILGFSIVSIILAHLLGNRCSLEGVE